MSEIKAIEKLRESSHLDDYKWTLETGEVVCVWNGEKPSDVNAVNWGEQWRNLADEIEREHEQRVAELNGAICERDGRIGSYERRNTELNDALKAICKRFGVSTEWSAEDAAKKVLEALERDYMKLPKDADGVSWTEDDDAFIDDLGDVYRLHMIAWSRVKQWYLFDQDRRAFLAKKCRHVKPRTVEDVLEDFARDLTSDRTDSYEHRIERLGTKYADEIRELMGGDA